MPKYRSNNENETAGCLIVAGILVLCMAVGFAWGAAIGWNMKNILMGLIVMMGAAIVTLTLFMKVFSDKT